jgi:acetyl esterase/lipase
VSVERDLPAFFAGLAAWAGERAEPAVHPYGSHPDQVADLREPASGTGRVAVVVHGGFWRSGFTRANTAAVAAALTLAGWRTWNLEYRRVGSGGGYPATLEDVVAFCRSLERPADVAVGHSAGAQLALWAAAEGLAAAAVALAGVCDLRAAAAAGLGDGAVEEFLGRAADDAPDADPARRLPLSTPVALVHGDRDDRVPIDHARAFARASSAPIVELTGADHFDVIDPRTQWWPEIARAIDAAVS